MKKIFSIILFTLLFNFAGAQDVIIKNDKSEIQAQVIEVTEDNIKYKKYDFLTGPIYNIAKTEVFMIIYKNGKRESYEVKPTQSNIINNSNQQTFNNKTNEVSKFNLDSETKSQRLNYAPWRLLFYQKGNINADEAESFYCEASFELRALKNADFLNIGLNSFSGSVKSESNTGNNKITSKLHETGLGLFASGYLPLNLLAKREEKLNKGFFPFARVGFYYSYFSGSTEMVNPYYYEDFSGDSFDIDYSVGLDYKFSKGFGLTINLQQFKTLWYGINFQF